MRRRPKLLLPRHIRIGIRIGKTLSLIGSSIGVVGCVQLAGKCSPTCGVRPIELLLAALWCIVCGYLSYSVVNGLLIRWIVKYSAAATLVRLLSFATINATYSQFIMTKVPSDMLLPAWIFNACLHTVGYAIQSFLTSNIVLSNKEKANQNSNNNPNVATDTDNTVLKTPRSMDVIQVLVFAVVPVGLASFVTTIVLLRLVFLLRPMCDLIEDYS